MNEQQAVKNAYDWACGVTEDRKASVMLLYCAKTIQGIVERNEDYGAAYHRLCDELANWSRLARQDGASPGVRKAARTLSLIMGLE